MWFEQSKKARASQVALVVKNMPANAGDIRETGSISGSGRSSGGGNGNPLQYFCLENPMDREAWQATVYGVTKRWTRLKWLSMHVQEGKLDRLSQIGDLIVSATCLQFIMKPFWASVSASMKWAQDLLPSTDTVISMKFLYRSPGTQYIFNTHRLLPVPPA